jgi:hypothetical protein
VVERSNRNLKTEDSKPARENMMARKFAFSLF